MIDVVMKLLSLFYFIVDVQLTTTNQVLLVVGVILWSVASIVGIISIVMRIVTRKGELRSQFHYNDMVLSNKGRFQYDYSHPIIM